MERSTGEVRKGLAGGLRSEQIGGAAMASLFILGWVAVVSGMFWLIARVAPRPAGTGPRPGGADGLSDEELDLDIPDTVPPEWVEEYWSGHDH